MLVKISQGVEKNQNSLMYAPPWTGLPEHFQRLKFKAFRAFPLFIPLSVSQQGRLSLPSPRGR